jgi:hypothetical protein
LATGPGTYSRPLKKFQLVSTGLPGANAFSKAQGQPAKCRAES